MNDLAARDPKFFERWYVLLAKQKFVAALLPLSGIAIGLFLVMSGHIAPKPFDWYISFCGTAMIGICAILFVAVAAVYMLTWIKNQ
jgi:hypothetical protein